MKCRQPVDGTESDEFPAGDDVELLRVPAGTPVKPSRSGSARRLCIGITALISTVGLIAHSVLSEWTDASELHLVTWNIAAINNNPFEYWITHEDADYNKLMVDVQEFISSPGERDVAVARVFTPEMW